MSSPSSIVVELSELPSLAVVGELWEDLQRRSEPSFFTSWSWIKIWLSQLPPSIQPQLLRARIDDRTVGLAILCRRRKRRHQFVTWDGLFLNETGDESLDHLTIEHNGLLVDRDVAASVVRECIHVLSTEAHEWDEFSFGGVTATNPLYEVIHQPPEGIHCQIARQSPCFVVNLMPWRESKTDPFETTGSRTWQQIRRSVRLYEEEAGPLSLTLASSLTEAMSFYDELKSLHQARWTAKGEPGAFGFEFCDRFHRALIAECFPRDEVHLLRIQAGSKTLGLLYQFIDRGRVYCYQSGFAYDDNDSRKKPGLVSHALAIRFYLERGLSLYDFLAGDHRYKRSLATNSEEMQWVVWQRPRWKFQVENWLRTARRKWAAMSHPA